MKTVANEPVQPGYVHFTKDGDITINENASVVQIKLNGLTKREHFAAMAIVDSSDMDKEFAEALSGYDIPVREVVNGKYTSKSLIAIAKFWCDVEAKYKVLKADALIAALNKEVTNG